MSLVDEMPEVDDRPTCFVVIGFGKKTDCATGRVLDLDLTYWKLIKPALDSVGVRGFRAVDINATGSIDILISRWIVQADIVVADLSTMNASVFYELGVRYAQKPSTTLIMAENGIFEKLPFDLSHTIIYGYEHLGNEIADAEVERFVPLLTRQIEKLKAEPPASPGDSPVYTYLQGMKVPEWQDSTERIAELEAMLEGRKALVEAAESGQPVGLELVQHQAISSLVDTAEAAKNRKDYPTAMFLYKAAIESAQKTASAAESRAGTETDGPRPKLKIDVSLWQRLALVTYKQVEKHDPAEPEANQEAIEALEEAMFILNWECDAKVSTDPETLGLSGAVTKRLYERTGDRKYFTRSVGFYERGFYIKQDHYNGISASFMYTVDAARLAEQGETFDAIVNYGHANILRAKVAEICEEMIADSERFARLKEPEWVYLSLWEAYFGMGRLEEAEELEPTIENVSPDFAIDTWHSQREKLGNAIGRFHEFMELAESPLGDAPPSPSTSQPVSIPQSRPIAVPEMTKDRVFVSYSHADAEDWYDRLDTYFHTVRKQTGIRIWSDQDIETGAYWHEKIQEAIRETIVAVLLVTQPFLASEYIESSELAPFLAARAQGEMDIFWIAVGWCRYDTTELADIQCANDPDEPLEGLAAADQNRTLNQISRKLEEAVLRRTGRKADT